MLLHQIPTEELRAACRQRLESCELWLRRIIHDRLSADLGDTYVQDGQFHGQHLFRGEIRRHAAERRAAQGMANEFNAPMFTRFSDCYGHVELLQSSRSHLDYTTAQPLHSGDSLRLDVETDAHFPPTEYTISWVVGNISDGERAQGPSFSLTLLPRHVGESFTVQATLVSNKNWHRHSNCDAYLTVSYCVLPLP